MKAWLYLNFHDNSKISLNFMTELGFRIKKNI